jgi:lysophospholipase L1-like esterase
MKRRNFLSGCVRAAVAAGFWFTGRQVASAQTNALAPTNAPTAPKPSGGQAPGQDWANLRRYHQENAQLPPPAEGENRVVFMGDSITDAWGRRYNGFFPGKPYVNRGISGQTTPQMLIRFRPDVIALKPKVVVILAGTNDLAGNTGPMTQEEILGNLISMAELAKANGIRVVLASVLPANDYPWRPEHPNPSDKIIALNAAIKDYAAKNGLVYLDYFSALVDEQNGLKKEYAQDAVHPNQAGYDVMGPLAEKAIEQTLERR